MKTRQYVTFTGEPRLSTPNDPSWSDYYDGNERTPSFIEALFDPIGDDE